MSELFLELLATSASTIELDTGSVDGPELVADGRRLAAEWARSGLRSGDRVGLWLPNGRRYLEALAACAAGGHVAVSVNTRWTGNEATSLLARSGARWLRTADEDRPVEPKRSSAESGQRLPALADGDRPFVVFTTSGTTSRPKMVLHGQQSIVTHGHDAARAFGYDPSGPVLVAMPLCGVFGLTSLVAAVAGGAPIVMPSVIDAVDIAHRVHAQRIRAMNGSDDLFHRILAAEEGALDLSSLKVGGYARFNTSLDGIVERAEQRGMIITGLYGMSEVQALFSLRDPAGSTTERQRAGGTVVSAQARARVVGDELQLRGPSLFTGYLAEGGGVVDEDLTAAAFTDDGLSDGDRPGSATDGDRQGGGLTRRGWFRTGDAAEMEDPIEGRDTFLYQARMGDVLRLGGFLVAPAEIEAALIDFPGVEAVQVVAVDRPTGTRPVAFVTGVAAGDAGDHFDERAAIEHCATRLARFKVPVRIIPIEEFPTTPSANGTKIQKVKLRRLAAGALDRDR
ncbi:MAG: AMP-binding protein [Acidimicrobiia bacterium]|nr:AMP-binding protein [Acidimicrobiia bacterium]